MKTESIYPKNMHCTNLEQMKETWISRCTTLPKLKEAEINNSNGSIQAVRSKH